MNNTLSAIVVAASIAGSLATSWSYGQQAVPPAQPAGPDAARPRGVPVGPAMAYFMKRNAATDVRLAPAPTAPPERVAALPNRSMVRPSKPFAAVPRGSTITPYLALDSQSAGDATLSNYFLFVRPQLEQQSQLRVQQAQYQQLQKKTQTSDGPRDSGDASGYSRRFMNSGNYFPSQR